MEKSTKASGTMWLNHHETRITLDAAPGLDRLDVVGPRGGRRVLWRQVAGRMCQVASWHGSRRAALTA